MQDNSSYTELPDFLIIGAGKSGTTSLNNYLKQHPQIFMPEKKEPNFFAYELINRADIVNNESLCRHYDGSVTSYNDYMKMFEGANDFQTKGETSNMYLYDPIAPKRIKHYIPNAKFIAILRNPVDRLYSRYLHLARENQHGGIDFGNIFDKNSIWYKRPDLLKEGFYYRNLSSFMRFFNKDQFHIILYDDFQKDKERVLKDVFLFLGVDPSFQADTTINYNKSGFIKNKFFNQFVDGKSLSLQTIQKVLPSVYKRAKTSIAFQKVYYSIKSKNLYRPKLDFEIRKRILNEIYKEDIESFQKLIDKDVSQWMMIH